MTKPDRPSSVAMEEVSCELAEYNNDPSFEIAWAIKVHFMYWIVCFCEQLRFLQGFCFFNLMQYFLNPQMWSPTGC